MGSGLLYIIFFITLQSLNSSSFSSLSSSNCFWHTIKELKPYINNYDYFIILRVDIEFLFPFPIKNFFSKIQPGIYTFKSHYCSSHGGYGGGVFIHKNYIEKYLTCYEDGLNNEKFTKILIDDKCMNQEKFLLMCMKEKNICFYDICHMNNYYTADSIYAYTTWSQPHFNSKYNIICKKDAQVDEVYKNYELWKNNYRWKFQNNKLFLEKSEE